jgi:predicted RNase H-like nuclease
VFTPPLRRFVTATHYDQVRGSGLSLQAFGIVPKIREVDRLMTPALQQRVYEAHPELAFTALMGHPMRYGKKTAAGREERLQALEHAPSTLFHGVRQALARALKTFRRTQVAPDDLLDAYVLVWTAQRIASATAHRVPPTPGLDQRGLRMEIWY